ncbi:MAG: YqaJ viral recombinase family protein, partial [Casimicrobiaceae bacterium]
DRILEIKVPMKGRDSSLWKSIEARALPEHYQHQVQHQLMVTKADIADVYIFDGTEGVVFPVAPYPDCWPRIQAAWDEFMRYVIEAQAPPLTDRDTRIRDDSEWLEAAAKYIELRGRLTRNSAARLTRPSHSSSDSPATRRSRAAV